MPAGTMKSKRSAVPGACLHRVLSGFNKDS